MCYVGMIHLNAHTYRSTEYCWRARARFAPSLHTLQPPAYVFIYVHVWVRTCTYIHTHTHTHIYIYIDLHAFSNVRAYMRCVMHPYVGKSMDMSVPFHWIWYTYIHGYMLGCMHGQTRKRTWVSHVPFSAPKASNICGMYSDSGFFFSRRPSILEWKYQLAGKPPL